MYSHAQNNHPMIHANCRPITSRIAAHVCVCSARRRSLQLIDDEQLNRLPSTCELQIQLFHEGHGEPREVNGLGRIASRRT